MAEGAPAEISEDSVLGRKDVMLHLEADDMALPGGVRSAGRAMYCKVGCGEPGLLLPPGCGGEKCLELCLVSLIMAVKAGAKKEPRSL